ncbi:hypothetical protein E4P42_24080 [Mycobacterium sp. PS03-16]|uniref:hypothetical protein n=1 Tax=Mycobacterium sp. PS03-16 TaxID=2559611 RepID=UPI00107461F7|nr:hypothetical protein [Mycobacterium sp. PS03-16]TFV55069.1 hypothetical protein E4P42_24080 [Mycobacterium sp. PS03-16]
MPDDLLRFVSGPTPYSAWWLWLAVALLVAVIAWYGLIIVATLPSHRLRGRRIIGPLHARVLCRRYVRRLAGIEAAHHDGRVTAEDACAQTSRTVRSFLHQATGIRAQYLHIDDLAAGKLAAAAPLLADLGEARFSGAAHCDVADATARAQELVRSWT